MKNLLTITLALGLAFCVRTTDAQVNEFKKNPRPELANAEPVQVKDNDISGHDKKMDGYFGTENNSYEGESIKKYSRNNNLKKLARAERRLERKQRREMRRKDRQVMGENIAMKNTNRKQKRFYRR